MDSSKVVVQSRSGQHIPPVLQKLLQRQQELSTDSHDTSSEGKSQPPDAEGRASSRHETPSLGDINVLTGKPQVKGSVGSRLGQTSSVFSPSPTNVTRDPRNDTAKTNKPMPDNDTINTLPNSTKVTGKLNNLGNLTQAKCDTLPASPKDQPTGAEIPSNVWRRKEAEENPSSNLRGQIQSSKSTAPSTNRFVTPVSTCAAPSTSVPRHSLSKTTLSTLSSPSSTSLSSSSLSSELATNVTTTTTTSENEGPVNFGINLRKTRNSVIEHEARISQRQPRASNLLQTRDLSETSLPAEAKTTQSAAEHQPAWKSNTTQGLQEHSSLGNPGTPQVDLIQSSRQGSVVTFRKLSLGQEFVKLTLPTKCFLPEGVDLTDITRQYRMTVKMTSPVEDDDVEEDYTDARSLEDSIRQWTPVPGVAKNNVHRRSEITSAVYDDGYTLKQNSPIDDEEYMEVGANGEVSTDELEEIYDDGTTMPEEQSSKDKKRQQKEIAEAKKRQEKERKEKEKEEQRLLKEKKAKEKKENEKKILQADANEVIGEGILQEDVKNLKLKKGQTVTIVRLNDNPPNMWLVKRDNIVGYVNSKIVKVEPSIILQAMTKYKKSIDEQEGRSIYDQL